MKGQEAAHPSSSAAQPPAAQPPAEDLLASRPGLICNNAWTNPALPSAMAYLGTEQPIEPAAGMLPAPVPVPVPEGMDAATVVMPMTCSVPLSSSSTSSAAASPHSATSPMPPSAEDQQLEQLLAQMLMGMDAVRPAAAWPTIHEGSDTPIFYQPAIPAEVEEAALAAAAVRVPACDLVRPVSPISLVDATKMEEEETWAPNSPAHPVCCAPAFAMKQKEEEEQVGEPPPPLASDSIASLPAAAEAPPTAAPAALVSDGTPAQEEQPQEQTALHSLDALDIPTDVLGDAPAASPHSASTESVCATSPAASPLQERSIALSPTTAAYHCLVHHQGSDTPMCYQPAIPAEVEEAASGGAAALEPALPPRNGPVQALLPMTSIDTTGMEEEEDWAPNSPARPVCFAPAFAVELEEEEGDEADDSPPPLDSEPIALHLPVIPARGAINAHKEQTDGAGHNTLEQTLEDCEDADAPQEEPALHSSLEALDNSMLQTDALLDDASAAAVASPHSASTESVYATSPTPAADAASTTGSETTEQQLMEQEEPMHRPTVRFQLPTEADMHSDVGSEGDAEQTTSAVGSAVQEAGLVALRGLLLVMLALLTAASWVWTWLRALW